MNRSCQVVIALFSFIYLAALALLAVGTFGLFGADRDPLSGAFLVPIGLPWNLLVDYAPEPLWPWLAMLAPAVNLVILFALCRGLARRRR